MSGRIATPQPTPPQRHHGQRSAVHAGRRSSGMAPASSIHSVPQSLSNRALHRMLDPLPLQAKLTISRPDDQFEREADRVADDVMRMPDASPATSLQGSPVTVHRACTTCDEEVHRQVDREDEPEIDETPEVVQSKSLSSSPGVQRSRPTLQISRMCGDCAKRYDESVARRTIQRQEEEEPDSEESAVVQTKPAAPGPQSELEANIQAQRGGGQPLPASTRGYFEERFGADFGHVRVHADSDAAATAQSIHAKAFTVGHDIAFNHGQYAPDSREGQHLLAHELTHVIQQRGASPPAAVMTKREPASGGGGRKKAARIDLKTAKEVMQWILDIINRVHVIEATDVAALPVPSEYKPLLMLWHQLTHGVSSSGSTTRLTGHLFLGQFELARALTEPLVRLIYRKGGGTWQNLLIQKWAPKYYEFEKRAESEKRILHLLETTTSFPFDPEPVDANEFLRVATAANTRPMLLQRGAGIQAGTAVAGKVYHPSKFEPRLVLWASPGGLFYEDNGEIYKQSQAGFSNDIILGVIIKAAQDVGPFVALMTAVLDIAISLIPGIGVVYDLTLAAKAAAEGRWKDAALEILPGGAIAGLAKIGKATKIGRAVVRGGARTAQFVGNAVSGAASFVAKGFRGIGRSAKRGMWLVSEGVGGKKAYHFMDDADPIWRNVDEAEAEVFIKCSKCSVTGAGKGDTPPAIDAPKTDAPSTGGPEKVDAPRAPRDVLSVIQNIDKTKKGALKELAGKIHGARAQGPVGQAIAIVEVEVVRKGKKTGEVIYVAAANASAPLTRQQRQLLKAAGIQIAPRAKGVKEVAHAEPHIRAWVERFATKTKAAQVRRWGISAGEKGAYICAACRQIAKQMGGEIEEFSSIGKTY